MSEQTGDEPLDIQDDIHQEKPPETVSAKESETISPNPATQIMETHAQELHKAPGQGLKHYLFEFLMLFLAIADTADLNFAIYYQQLWPLLSKEHYKKQKYCSWRLHLLRRF
jgi:hypothetical protein